MGLADASSARSKSAADADPTVSTSLEHLITASQGVLTKRVDLAMLEGQEAIARFVERAALAGIGMLLAAGAWFAVTGALVQFAAPTADPALRLAAFGLLSAAGAFGFFTLARRSGSPADRHRDSRPSRPRDAETTGNAKD